MLYVVATPIGEVTDLSIRAQTLLKDCSLIIGEEKKETDLLLKRNGAYPKEMFLLNEHSTPQDIQEMAQLCKKASPHAVLVSDCGTPGFCDPGAELVAACRKLQVPVRSSPGPSSLMAFLSVAGVRLEQFYFRGFLPRETTDRTKAWQEIARSPVPTIIMETPYRLKKIKEELKTHAAQKRVIVGLELSTSEEKVLDGNGANVLEDLTQEKGEFLLLVMK